VLLARQCGRAPDAGFVAACHAATGGNPALVRELALSLGELAIAPVDANAHIVEQLALRPVGRRVLDRLSMLGRPTTALAIASAVLGDGASIAHAARLARMTEPAVATALEALRRHGVLVSSDRVRFVQPLVGRSILAATRPGELCDWHRRAADVLDEVDAPFEEIAAYSRRTAPAADRVVVGRLRLGAHRARQVGDAAAAAAYLRRALEEGVKEFEADLALELANVEARRCPADAIVLLERVLRLTPTPAGRAAIEAQLRRLEHELSAAVHD
jgi:hypothetical protein